MLVVRSNRDENRKVIDLDNENVNLAVTNTL